jgi:hypothetical protein
VYCVPIEKKTEYNVALGQDPTKASPMTLEGRIILESDLRRVSWDTWYGKTPGQGEGWRRDIVLRLG